MTDAVVVLGAATVAPGVPGPALVRRLDHGVRVLLARNARYLLVTGGVVGPPPAEAQVMWDLARARGVADDRILIEDQARNTFENALYAGRMLRERGLARVIIVTDGFHLPRALYVFRRLGLPVAGEGVPQPAETSRRAWLREHVDERLRLARSAMLFALGVHKPMVARVWGDADAVPADVAGSDVAGPQV